MIEKQNDLIILTTPNTEFILREYEYGTEILYYGKRLKNIKGIEVSSLINRRVAYTSTNNYSAYSTVISYFGDGNDNEPFLKIVNANGNFTNKFSYRGCDIGDYKILDDKLPQAYDGEKTLTLVYRDDAHKIRVNLYISTFSNSDVLAFSSEVINLGDGVIYVDGLSSVQLEFDGEKNFVYSFDGAWGRERHTGRTEVSRGTFVIDSKNGSSSNKHNPFTVAYNERLGRYLAFNPVWSGNHKFVTDVSPLGQTRFLAGLSDFMLHYPLKNGERFVAPQTIVANCKTFEEISAGMHDFVKKHIVPERFLNKERPVLLNNWEATYFDFNGEKLRSLIDTAKEVGIELFVLDDGWFGGRSDDHSSLGDWTDNESKTGGLASLADYARKKGLGFGIWVEPEMISKDSDLYRAHPEYAMRLNEAEPIEMRWQLMLDLCNDEVADYVINALIKVFDKCKPDYVKWDCNRVMTDIGGTGTYYGRYFYDYYVNLYRILKTVTERYPDAIFEGCASGGNRFDLGILAFMPQIWASDDTDARERLEIQAGTLAAYPQNTMGAHVSASPNHQTGNQTPLTERFIVAVNGAFGYELDLAKLSADEISAIKRQIKFYKEHRKTLQFGDCSVIANDEEKYVTATFSEDKKECIVSVVFKNRRLNAIKPKIRLNGFDDNAVYRATVFERDETFTASGEVLNNCELDLFNLANRNSTNAVSGFLLCLTKI